METIIITGVCGFIGHNLAKSLLERGYKVVGIDNCQIVEQQNSHLFDLRKSILDIYPQFNYINYDLSKDIETLKDYFDKAQFVIHLAARAGIRQSMSRHKEYIINNVLAFSNVIMLSARSKIKHFIYASSSSVYGDQISIDGSKESDEISKPLSVYAVTKRANELEAYAITHSTGMKTTGLRFFSVYGPYGRKDMAPWIFAKSLIENRPIHLINEGKSYRDFTYIDDVVSCIIRVIETERNSSYEIYNIGSFHPRSVRNLLELLELNLSKCATIVTDKFDNSEVVKTYSNTRKFIEEYGVFNFTPLEKGISLFSKWYVDNLKFDL